VRYCGDDLADGLDGVFGFDGGRWLILINMVEAECGVARADAVDLSFVE
jgi:hypothetical protein